VVSIDSDVVLLLCASDASSRRFPLHRSRRRTAPSGVTAAGIRTVALPARPGKSDLDPVLVEHAPRRVIVAGTDADLAAVLVRLLRTERTGVEVAFLPAARSSAAAAVWGLPTGRAAAALALEGRARPVPLVRDDAGGVLVGRGEIRDLHGEAYCDDTLVLRGRSPRLVVAPSAGGVAVRAGRGAALPDGSVRAVPPRAPAGRGAAVGRAVQIGCLPAAVVVDGVAHPRPVPRWTWYRHTSDWLLVRP
jgi:hypothetical protein